MRFNSQISESYVIKKPKDREARYQTLEQDIRCLSAELCRLIALPYTSEAKRTQIMYIDSLIATYESEQRKFE